MKSFIDAVHREQIKRRAREPRVRRIYLSLTEVPGEEAATPSMSRKHKRVSRIFYIIRTLKNKIG